MIENKPSILKKEENTIYDKYASLLIKDRIRNIEKEELERIIKKDGEIIEMMEYIYEKQRNILYKENEKLKTENEEIKRKLMKKDVKIERLREQNEKLQDQISMLKTTILRNEAYIERMQHKGEWRK